MQGTNYIFFSISKMVSVIVHSSIIPLYVWEFIFLNQHGLIELFCAGNTGTNIIIKKMAVFVLWLCFWTIAASLNNGFSSPFLSLGVGPLRVMATIQERRDI